MASRETAVWLPGFVRDGMVSAPSVWGKLPSRGDYIRHHLRHDQAEGIQDWIRTQLRVAKTISGVSTRQDEPDIPTSVTPTRTQTHRHNPRTGFWHDLSPSTSRASPVLSSAMTGQSALPWCFVLPPNSLPFARQQHVIGVWMESSDKIGRRYPLVMMQTASPRWIRQVFRNHAAQPCDWLYFAARCMAHTVYAEEAAQDRPHHSAPDHAATLISQLTQLWLLYQPGWREALGRGAAIVNTQEAQAIVGETHREDIVRTLDGVRYLPWTDWPQRLIGAADSPAQAAFWQQDWQGRFVGAGEALWAG